MIVTGAELWMMMTSPQRLLAAVVVLAMACVPGCTSARRLLGKASPHEAYSTMLRQTGLDRTALGQDWIEASETSLRTAVTVSTPFQEAGYFPSSEAMAVSYRMDLKRGRRLSVEVSFDSDAPAQLFADLFQLSDEGPPRRVSFLEAEQSSFLHEVERDGSYILRLQPELLRGGRFALTQRTLASLRFPISGLTTQTVQSAFGAERDAGAREHEGVDIFVPRGTPAVAVASGLARPGRNALGGTVVWLHEPAAGRTFYYAHLDAAAIDGAQYVREGDVVGYVGNTGNARSTSPHLHFGIYERGAIDPLPFLRPDDPTPARPERVSAHLGDLVRVITVRASLRAGPALDQPRLALLGRNTVARVLGSTTDWLRVSLPEDTIGYVSAELVASVNRPVRRAWLSETSTLRETPLATSPIVDVLEPGVRVDVLGSFEEYDLLRGPSGRAGWANTRHVKGRRRLGRRVFKERPAAAFLVARRDRLGHRRRTRHGERQEPVTSAPPRASEYPRGCLLA